MAGPIANNQLSPHVTMVTECSGGWPAQVWRPHNCSPRCHRGHSLPIIPSWLFLCCAATTLLARNRGGVCFGQRTSKKRAEGAKKISRRNSQPSPLFSRSCGKCEHNTPTYYVHSTILPPYPLTTPAQPCTLRYNSRASPWRKGREDGDRDFRAPADLLPSGWGERGGRGEGR